jgi:peptide/nickel transport system substrate-binding protein
MYRKTLVVALIFMLLLASIPMVAFAAQPPVDPNTLILGTVGMPARADPATAYDTASGALIMNVYEPLIDFARNTSEPDPRKQGRIDQFEPRLATAMPTKEVVTLDLLNLTVIDQTNPKCTIWNDTATGKPFHINGWRDNNVTEPDNDAALGPGDVIYMEEVNSSSPPYEWIPCTKFAWQVKLKEHVGNRVHLQVKRTWYVFELRTGVRIHPWKYYNGTLAPDANLTTEDVEYHFERVMVQDRLYGPQWMFYKPILDAMNSEDGWNLSDVNDLTDLAKLIDCAIQRNSTHIWINVGIDFPEIAWYQILATYGYIVPKAFAIDHGCWDGTFFNATGYPHWKYYCCHVNYWPTSSRSPLDRAPTTLAPPGFVGRVPPLGWTGSWAGHAEPAPILRGTGPYKFTEWNTVTQQWRIDRNLDYWGGWPTGVDPHRYYVNTFISKNIAEWTTRKFEFLAGDVDNIVVPRAYMYDLMEEQPPGSGNWVPLPGIVCYKDIPTLSSDSLHYQFNVTAGSPYMPTISSHNQSDFFGNVYARRAFAYALNFTQLFKDAWFDEAEQPATWHISGLAPDYRDLTIKKYDINTTRVEEELKAAIYDGTSLWDSGFHVTLCYNLGNDQRKIACEMIEYTIEHMPGTHGLFVVDVVGLDWASPYLDYISIGYLPCWQINWLVDFADADNWVRPYMHSYGDFSFMQGYINSTVDVEIDLAVKTPDGPERQAIYYDLQHTFINECPTLMIAQPYGRAWMRDWVQGWYYNPLFPGEPIRDRWKGFKEDFNRDMKVNLLDLVKVAAKFGTTVPPTDPIYDLNKDGKINLSDLIRCWRMAGAGVP